VSTLSDLTGLEQTAAAQSRRIPIDPVSWGQIVNRAQVELGASLRGGTATEPTLEGEEALRMVAAARILDASASAELVPDSRASLQLLSAASFALNGNFPSASAVARALYEGASELTETEWVALTVFSPRLITRSIDNVTSGSAERNFLELLNRYFLTGEPELERTLKDSLNRVMENALDPFSTMLIGYAHLALDILLRHSLAKVFRSERIRVPPGYLEALLDSAVRVLLPPQVAAITQSRLLDDDKNILISFPTSTGKTLLGELTIHSSLTEKEGVAVYIAPYVALAGQIHDTFAKRMPPGITLHAMIGGYGVTNSFDFEVGRHVVVATPERFDALVRSHPNINHHLRSVVIDEAHIVSNAVRGIRLEGIITRLRMLQSRGLRFRIVCLSAVIGDTDAMINWLGSERSLLISTDWRSTARRIHFWSEEGRLLWLLGDDVLSRDGQTPSSVIASERLPWPEPNIYPSATFAQTRRQSAMVHRNVAYLAQRLIDENTGPVLCLCGSKPGTRALANEIAVRLSVPEVVPGLIEDFAVLLRSKYPYLGALAAQLEKGVAYHNASLPTEVRKRIEEAIMAGHVRAVAATTTLAEGIDLPFYSTILVDWLVWDGTKSQPIDPLLFRNIAGRSGRAGFHTEGEMYVFDNVNGHPQFTGPQVRRSLQREIFFASEPPDLLSVAEGSDFLTRAEFVAATDAQFVAAIPENPDVDDLVPEFVRHSFAALRKSVGFGGFRNDRRSDGFEQIPVGLAGVEQ
jgi:helicase